MDHVGGGSSRSPDRRAGGLVVGAPIPDRDGTHTLDRRRNSELAQGVPRRTEQSEQQCAPPPLFDQEQEVLGRHRRIRQPVGAGPRFALLEAVTDLVRFGVSRGVGLGIGEHQNDLRTVDDTRGSRREPFTGSRHGEEAVLVGSIQHQEVGPLGKPRRRCATCDVADLEKFLGRGAAREGPGHAPTPDDGRQVVGQGLSDARV